MVKAVVATGTDLDSGSGGRTRIGRASYKNARKENIADQNAEPKRIPPLRPQLVQKEEVGHLQMNWISVIAAWLGQKAAAIASIIPSCTVTAPDPMSLARRSHPIGEQTPDSGLTQEVVDSRFSHP